LFERDPLIQERHSLVPLVHPIRAASDTCAPPSISRFRDPSLFARPSIGEHNRQIAAALCGLSAARIDELQLLGVFK
jgi:crotonobetainyl-CoA:carnitine CoA-transferase CaiB-like acyl-CoA transferase